MARKTASTSASNSRNQGSRLRALPGTANACMYRDPMTTTKKAFLISDMFTAPPVRRKIMQKRMRKVDNLLKELPAPELEGPADAEVTLVTWGSTHGVVHEAAELLTNAGH